MDTMIVSHLCVIFINWHNTTLQKESVQSFAKEEQKIIIIPLEFFYSGQNTVYSNRQNPFNLHIWKCLCLILF